MKAELIKSDFSKLNKFIKELESGYAVDVGIMGARNTKIDREENGVNNAELGFIHEFGLGVPMRSFIRMPIQSKTNQILKDVMEAGALKKLGNGDVVGVMSDIGIACETAIGDAFDTGGFGDWAPNTEETARKKGSDSPLIDTGQLRRSIASEVVKL